MSTIDVTVKCCENGVIYWEDISIDSNAQTSHGNTITCEHDGMTYTLVYDTSSCAWVMQNVWNAARIAAANYGAPLEGNFARQCSKYATQNKHRVKRGRNSGGRRGRNSGGGTKPKPPNTRCKKAFPVPKSRGGRRRRDNREPTAGGESKSS